MGPKPRMSDPAAPRPIRIIIVDDHTLFRDLLARDLARHKDFEIVGTCATVQNALALVSREAVDVVLLDIDLGHEQGGEFLSRAADAGFTGKVIVVTAGVYASEATRLARLGASAIFRKHEPSDALAPMIRDVAAGLFPPLPDTVDEADTGSPALHRPLSMREAQVLRLIFDGKANKEIAEQLQIGESLVKEVIQRLFRKTGVRNRGQLVRVALEKYWDEITSSE